MLFAGRGPTVTTAVAAPPLPATVAVTPPVRPPPIAIEKPGILVPDVAVPDLPGITTVTDMAQRLPSGLSVPGKRRLRGREHRSSRQRREAAGAN
jgi:hypothetical protein